MKTVVVGDLHGRYSIVDDIRTLVENQDYDAVFVGDYLDDYTRTVVEQKATLEKVLDLAEEFPTKVTALVGNHELSYLNPIMRCSGFNTGTYAVAMDLKDRMLSTLKEYTWKEGFLITHAGLDLSFFTDNVREYSPDKYDVAKFLESEDFDLMKYKIGFSRGGRSPCGGIFWLDFYRELIPIPFVPQIVGHSGYRPPGTRKGVDKRDNVYNVDCFQHSNEVLVIDRESSSIHDLNDLVYPE